MTLRVRVAVTLAAFAALTLPAAAECKKPPQTSAVEQTRSVTPA